MTEQRSRRAVLAGAGAAATLALSGCTGLGARGRGGSPEGPGDATIFHAGSLAPPFAAVEPAFEAETGIDVTREPKGSVASTKKITQQGRRADVLGVSDFRLLRDRLLPEDGDWYAIFATNAMALQYTEASTGAADLSRDNWWAVLARDDVTVAHADPAVDPGGYRAVMTQQLGAVPFEGERLYDEATYRAIRANSVVPTGTETKLTAQLRSGAFDYAFYYRSLAEQADLPSVDLQPAVDLSRASGDYARHYAEAEVETDAGTFVGAPIAYGLTVPSVAGNPEAGARWVEQFATDPGRSALREAGLQPVEPVVVPASGESAVPERVRSHARAAPALGPLEL